MTRVSKLYSGLELQCLNNFFEQFHLDRLRKHLIHATLQSLINIRFFCMPGYSYNYWLIQIVIIKSLSDQICSFISVHHRHVAIHNNQIVIAKLPFVFFDAFFDKFKSLLSIKSFFTDHLDIDHSD